MVRAEAVSRKYGHFQALNDVSFTTDSGEVIGLLGQNGAGKSTLMNVMAGCLAPSGGRVFIAGHDIVRSPFAARRALGYLSEVPPVYPELTVREYLQFCCRIKGVMRADEQRHLDEIISLTGLMPMQHRLIGQLSKGFRQRTGLAQALCGDPEVLLLDEPTAGFDPAQAVAFRKLIRTLVKDKTIIFSSHLLHEVQEVCDRVLIIHQGQLLLEHDLHQAAQSSRYRVVILGEPERLLSPIRQLNSVCRVRQEKTAAGQTRLVVETKPNEAFAQQLFRLLSAMGTPVLELSPLTDTLETLFLQATGGGDME